MSSHQSSEVSPPQLNREAVVHHALALADAEGLVAVTIRRLAQEFGVTPMALYWHFSNKEELLAAMGDQLFVGLPPDTDVTAQWQDRLRELVLALTTALRAHPAMAILAAPRVLQNDEGRLLTEQALEILRSAGFPVDRAGEIARHILRTAISLVIEQAATGASTDSVERAHDINTKRSALQSLPVDQFPRLVEAADALANCSDENAYYGFGVDLLIAGIDSVRLHSPPRA
ncbi:TetR/AcrR family transcriptional regulator [Acidithrix ferrooxidans]|uniref:TetR/AcrR family transcriptional regulator n=1 Tax=Acidithrix ferrooxidans TaxID=1280514 RepID=UPI00069898C5|nr:TetR family transcriptional regulator [Acidithrix ferrooxidans]